MVRHYAQKNKILDIPNDRSSHTSPTPRGGGLAIVLSWYTGLAYLYTVSSYETNLILALSCGTVLAVVSLIDDVMNVSATLRLIAQAISALGALYFLNGFSLYHGIEISATFWISNMIILIGIIWFINLFNFLDGIDAYASLEAILVAIGLFILTSDRLMLILIAAVAGFLVWNWPKAKIFMGDIGSTQLGFILAVFAVHFHNNDSVSLITWLVLTSLFWFDATITLLMRWLNNEKLTRAHKKHIYQRLNQSGFSHLKVDLYAIAVNIVLIGLTYFNSIYLQKDYLTLAISVLLLIILMRSVEKRLPFS